MYPSDAFICDRSTKPEVIENNRSGNFGALAELSPPTPLK